MVSGLIERRKPIATTPITVVLVDDHTLFRQGVKALLSSEPHIEVVGEAGTGSEAMTIISRLHPDVVMLDIRLPDSNGIEVSKVIKASSPCTKILILSAYAEEQYIDALARLGVAGYLAKTASAEELVRAVRDAAEGWLLFAPGIAPKVMVLLQQNVAPNSHQGLESRTLTLRETEVLQHMAGGLRNGEIAHAMGVAAKTVEAHIENILLKLKVRNRTEAVVVALKEGLLIKPAIRKLGE